MKKKIIIIFIIIVILLGIIASMYAVDLSRMNKGKNVVFSTWGTKYEAIVNAIEKNYENEEYTGVNNALLIKVNGKMYIYKGKTNNDMLRCGMMDGKITYNGDSSKEPTQNNQSNFEGEYEFQYGAINDTIELYKDENWLVFEIFDNWAEKNLVTLEVYSTVAEDLFKEFILSKEDSIYLIGLTNTMRCRDYSCDGIAIYHYKIDNQNYGIEIYEKEIHIIPYSDNIDNEAIISGQEYIDLKNILDKYPVFEIDYENTRRKENVTIEVQKDTITSTSISITITDNNQNHYGWGVEFKVQKKINGEWKELEYISDELAWESIAYVPNKDNKLDQKLDIEKYYGKLSDGIYRIVKPVYDNGYIYMYSNEFEIK